MVKLSANKAAEVAKVAKATLLSALKSGELSGSKNSKGHWEIDTAELFRVFPKTVKYQSIEQNSTTKENHLEASILQVKLDALQGRFEDAQTIIEDLRKEKDLMRQDFRQSLALLTDQRPSATHKPRQSLWARLTGRGSS